MRRRNRQARIRTAEDLLFKIVVSLVLALAAATTLVIAFGDDGSKAASGPSRPAASDAHVPRRVPTVGSTAPTTTTTSTVPTGPTPDQILAFTAAMDQAKASTAAAFARLVAFSAATRGPARRRPRCPTPATGTTPSTTAARSTPTAATTTTTTTIVPTTTTTVPTTTTTRRGKGKP